MPNVAANAAARARASSVERVLHQTSQTVCLCVTELADSRHCDSCERCVDSGLEVAG